MSKILVVCYSYTGTCLYLARAVQPARLAQGQPHSHRIGPRRRQEKEHAP